MVGKRPEQLAPADLLYDQKTAWKYLKNSRMNHIQKEMTVRALELLRISPSINTGKNKSPYSHSPLCILDIGCGVGLSGEVIEEYGHYWQGVDISRDMLTVALEKTDSRHSDVGSAMILHDIGMGLPFRAATFDAAISISTLQWLCNADQKSHIPQRRLKIFFQSLFSCLRRGGRAVFQLYPENNAQMQMIMTSAKLVGFGGGLVVDYPNSTTAKKYYLVLQTDGDLDRIGTAPSNIACSKVNQEVSRKRNRSSTWGDSSSESDESSDSSNFVDSEPNLGIPEEVNNTFKNPDSRTRRRRSSAQMNHWKPKKGSKSWILLKKEQQRMIGKKTARDSKYTGRKRPRKS